MIKHKNEAFTIIEVVLVLAIAGLIFLMVFIALPALQRSQRNAGYKNNVAVVSGLVQSFKANNRGQLPSYTGDNNMSVGSTSGEGHPFYSYVQNSGLPPAIIVKVLGSGNIYVGSSLDMVFGRILILSNSECVATSKPWEGQLGRAKQGSVAVLTILEEGGGIVYCENV